MQPATVTTPRIFPVAPGPWAPATQISVDAYASLLRQYQVPEEFVSLITYLFTEVLDGRNARWGDGVPRALGRPPRDFTDYARATAATGVWNP